MKQALGIVAALLTGTSEANTVLSDFNGLPYGLAFGMSMPEATATVVKGGGARGDSTKSDGIGYTFSTSGSKTRHNLLLRFEGGALVSIRDMAVSLSRPELDGALRNMRSWARTRTNGLTPLPGRCNASACVFRAFGYYYSVESASDPQNAETWQLSWTYALPRFFEKSGSK